MIVKKLFVAASLVCLVAACGGLKPEDTVKGFFDAMKAGDGAKAASYLSQGTIDEMSSGLEELKADTTGFALGMMSSMLGVEMTADQLADMDGLGFAAMLLGSDMMKEQLGTVDFTIGSATINGDRAVVTVSMVANGETTEDEVELVKENGAWKLDMPEFGM